MNKNIYVAALFVLVSHCVTAADHGVVIKEPGSPLHKAILDADLATVQTLVPMGGYDVNALVDGETVLHLAITSYDPTLVAVKGEKQSKKSLAIIQHLLDYRANVNALNEFGQSPLSVAIEHHMLPVVEMLLKVYSINLELEACVFYLPGYYTPLALAEAARNSSPCLACDAIAECRDIKAFHYRIAAAICAAIKHRLLARKIKA